MFDKNKVQLILFFILYFLLFFAAPVLADTPAPDVPATPSVSEKIDLQMGAAGIKTGLGEQDPRETAARAINISLGILGILFVCYVIYAGFLYMTAGGEEEKVEESKKHLRNAIIGLAIILAALSISLLITTYLIRATKEPWHQPPLPYDIIQIP